MDSKCTIWQVWANEYIICVVITQIKIWSTITSQSSLLLVPSYSPEPSGNHSVFLSPQISFPCHFTFTHYIVRTLLSGICSENFQKSSTTTEERVERPERESNNSRIKKFKGIYGQKQAVRQQASISLCKGEGVISIAEWHLLTQVAYDHVLQAC